MASGFEWLRSFEFDKKRIEECGSLHFQNELSAARSNEKICDFFKIAFDSGDKFTNPNNSYVGFVLGITDEKPCKSPPIYYDNDLPDIDLDLSDEHRELAFDYLAEKYGRDHVAQLGTVMLYKPDSVIKETCGALSIPKWDAQSLKDVVEDRPEGHPRAYDAIEDALPGSKLIAAHPEFQIATQLEGHPRHSSRHAAGVIITADKIASHVAIDARTNSTQCEKRDAEKMDMLKIDLLGLTQLSIFEHALKLIKKPREWLQEYPLDDEKVFEIFNSGYLTGVFQFNGDALAKLIKQIKVTSFDDIVSLTSLVRPGPMQSGETARWVKRKNGEPVVYAHPTLEPILHKTYGCVVYQEQVMRICRDVGLMEWSDVSAVRKAMGKSMGLEYMDKWRTIFVAGATKNGWTNEEANTYWGQLCEYGAYGFNASHAVSYSIISYWCAVLKKYHPLEFAAATLSREKDSATILSMLRDLDREGLTYKSIDTLKSGREWSISDDGMLIGPLSGIKGVGPAAVEEIIRWRDDMSIPCKPRTSKLVESAKTEYDILFPIKTKFPSWYQRSDMKIEKIDLLTDHEVARNVSVVAEIVKIDARDKNDSYNTTKRNGAFFYGQSKYVTMNVRDDYGSINVHISTKKYNEMAAEFLNRGLKGRPVYGFNCHIGPGYRMLHLNRFLFLGTLEDVTEKELVSV
jgi:DNA polymerase III alpha subunit